MGLLAAAPDNSAPHDALPRRPGWPCWFRKFGGTSLASIARSRPGRGICRQRGRVTNLLICLGDGATTTDEATGRAHAIHADPPQRELDMLLAPASSLDCPTGVPSTPLGGRRFSR